MLVNIEVSLTHSLSLSFSLFFSLSLMNSGMRQLAMARSEDNANDGSSQVQCGVCLDPELREQSPVWLRVWALWLRVEY